MYMLICDYLSHRKQILFGILTNVNCCSLDVSKMNLSNATMIAKSAYKKTES